MKTKDFMDILQKNLAIDFYTGVPDSLLSPLINQVMEEYGVSSQHMIAANEGNAVALAAGYHLATGKTPCIYMQNSGQGNMLNPYASLMAPEVYRIPGVFIIGWRSEPGISDEPQHVFQGKITKELMELLQIPCQVITDQTTTQDFSRICDTLKPNLDQGQCVALIICKNALEGQTKKVYQNLYQLKREAVIEEITAVAGADIFVCTTGKASRELFEIRDKNGQGHERDFLTVGSMGHASSIALGIALQQTEQTVWCIDGDGALLMHMGAMALIGSMKPGNLIHVLMNNEAHETVGGMPTVSASVDFTQIAKGCGYEQTYLVTTKEELVEAVREAKAHRQLTMIEVKTAQGSRSDLGRPTTTPVENKKMFMKYVQEK